MDNIHFSNSFLFRHITLKKYRHNDNTNGINCHFVGKMLCGSGVIRTVSGEELELSAGDVFYLPLGLRYDSYWTPDVTGVKTVEWCSYGFDFFPCREGKQYVMQKLNPSEQAMEHLDKIDLEQGVTTLSVGLLYIFLGVCIPTMVCCDYDANRELYSRAKNYICQHERFKVSDLARYCGMSESGLYAFFRAYANTTPIEQKNIILAQKAVAFLCSTDISLEEIAARLRIQSVAYLRKIVKKQTGKTPSEIRKEGFAQYNL